MYDLRNVFMKRPVEIAGAVKVVLMAAILLGVVSLGEQGLAALVIALEAVLGLFVKNSVVTVENAERHPDGDPA